MGEQRRGVVSIIRQTSTFYTSLRNLVVFFCHDTFISILGARTLPDERVAALNLLGADFRSW